MLECNLAVEVDEVVTDDEVDEVDGAVRNS